MEIAPSSILSLGCGTKGGTEVSYPLCCLVRSKYVYLFQPFAVLSHERQVQHGLVPRFSRYSEKEKNLPVHLKQCSLHFLLTAQKEHSYPCPVTCRNQGGHGRRSPQPLQMLTHHP